MKYIAIDSRCAQLTHDSSLSSCLGLVLLLYVPHLYAAVLVVDGKRFQVLAHADALSKRDCHVCV